MPLPRRTHPPPPTPEVHALKTTYASKLLAFNYSKAWVARNPGTFAALVADSLQHTRKPAGIAAQGMGVGMFNVEAQLPSLSLPVLVVHGDDDAIIPVDCGRDIARLIPGRFGSLPPLFPASWSSVFVCFLFRGTR